MSDIKENINAVIHEAFLLGYNNHKNHGSYFTRGDNIPVKSRAVLLESMISENIEHTREEGGVGDRGFKKY